MRSSRVSPAQAGDIQRQRHQMLFHRYHAGFDLEHISAHRHLLAVDEQQQFGDEFGARVRLGLEG